MTTALASFSTGQIYSFLQEVKDPEIPVLSLVDLGVITNVAVQGRDVKVEMTPTFVGCPAIDYMKMEVESCLKSKGLEKVEVVISFHKPWSSDLISEKGKKALKTFGIAPPSSRQVFEDLEMLETAVCPRCNGTNTELRNPFGPTLCRAIFYCHQCREAFEQFKPV